MPDGHPEQQQERHATAESEAGVSDALNCPTPEETPKVCSFCGCRGEETEIPDLKNPVIVGCVRLNVGLPAGL